MATCPNCKGEMSVLDPVCPHCGYDFPLQAPAQKKRRGIAYSALGDWALVVGMICSAVGSLTSLVLTVLAMLAGSWGGAFSSGLTFFVLLALYVVFQRVADLE